MLKCTITIVTLISFCFYLYGCYTITSVDTAIESIEDYKECEITAVITNDYKLYEFNRSNVENKPRIIDSTLIGWTCKTILDSSDTLKAIRIPVSKIKSLYIEKENRTIKLLIFGATVGLIVYLLTTIDFRLKINTPI